MAEGEPKGKPRSLQAEEFLRRFCFKEKAEDEDGGVFVETIKSRDVKLGSAATKKRAKRRSEVLKLPNLPE